MQLKLYIIKYYMKTTKKIFIAIFKFILFLNISINAQTNCGNEAGFMPESYIPACHGDFVSTSSINTNISAANSTLIYILHNDPSSISIGDIIAYSSIGVFYNDGTLPTYQDLFISAYVGPLNQDGSPILNDECADVALPGTPVIFYGPIELIEEGITCDQIAGCITVEFSLSGGAPDIPGDTFYQYFVEGDYDGYIEGSNEVVFFSLCNNQYNYTIEVVDDGKYCNALFNNPIFCDSLNTSNLVIGEGSLSQNLYHACNSIITSGTTEISNGQQVKYKAPRVILNEGFSAKAGCDFKVRYYNCE